MEVMRGCGGCGIFALIGLRNRKGAYSRLSPGNDYEY